jgi:hypothetical protein
VHLTGLLLSGFHLVLSALHDLKELYIIIVINRFLEIRTVNSVSYHIIYSVFQISAEVDTELVIIITISIIQNESYNKTLIIVSL